MNIYIHGDVDGYYSKVFRLAETRNWHRIVSIGGARIWYLQVADPSIGSGASYRHQGRGNFLFLDGHVSSHTMQSLYDIGAWTHQYGHTCFRPYPGNNF